MNKLDLISKDLLSENIKFIKNKFPNVVTESAEGIKIDFDLLKQELSGDIVEGPKERYQLTWPGKKEAILTANTPTINTLRPLKEKSVDFDTTENIYIEGDNLEALKILQESYLGKIDIIYIDPPYNTGRNLIYKNDYKKSEELENYISGISDENKNILISNTKNNGRFHSDWLTMMYPRIKLARNLLCNEGIIIIAIDDNEFVNLRKIVDEVFGEENFVGTIVTRCNPQGRGKKNIDPTHEYHMIYSKNKDYMPELKIPIKTEIMYKNFMRSGTNSRKYERPKRFYPMLIKNDKVSCILHEEYKEIFNETEKTFNEKFMQKLTEKYEKLDFRVIWPIAQNGEEKVWQRVFERALLEHGNYIFDGNQIKTPGDDYRTPMSLWTNDIFSNVAYGTNKLNALFDNIKVFDYSKSINTVKDMLSLGNNNIVLDFFSGSATTAEAILRLNSKDNGNRKYIMVQLPEVADEKSEAYNAGFKTICDIGEERIRRVSARIKAETNAEIDYGFRVYKIDSSNMKTTYYTPDEYTQGMLDSFESNIKEDRTDLDILTEIMLDLGLTLNLPIETTLLNNQTVHFIAGNSLIACFENIIENRTIELICKEAPLKVIFKDESFRTDNEKINLQEQLKKLSPETEISIL